MKDEHVVLNPISKKYDYSLTKKSYLFLFYCWSYFLFDTQIDLKLLKNKNRKCV